MTFRNCTPHVIGLIDDQGRRVVLQPARYDHAEPQRTPRVLIDIGPEQERHDGVAVHGPAKFAGIADLPPRRPGTIYVVSKIMAMFAAAVAPDRDDIVYPATDPEHGAVREADACKYVTRLVRAAH